MHGTLGVQCECIQMVNCHRGDVLRADEDYLHAEHMYSFDQVGSNTHDKNTSMDQCAMTFVGCCHDSFFPRHHTACMPECS